jgi:hypothetical protein
VWPFDRACRSCGQKPAPTVAPPLSGHSGQIQAELTNFPYKACRCGKKVKWAFDPGVDFSTQLFYEGVPTARDDDGGRCAGCEGGLDGAATLVVLTLDVQLEGLQPVRARITAPGFRCPSCGLEQAAPGTLESFGYAEALSNAIATTGL